MANDPNDPRDAGHVDPVAGPPRPAAPSGVSAGDATIAAATTQRRHPGPRVELEPTIVSGERRPGSDVELEQTILSGGAALRAPAEPVAVRAGRTDDDLALATIDDPQRYVVEGELARGGMGRILAARDRRLGRPVAIKELLPGSDELRARFAREARITAKLQHPAIVNLLEAATWPSGEPFYVMKLVAGESLDRTIARHATLDARLGLLPHVIAAADALAYAHSERVIHRDLKPGNVLVGAFGETVVIDWGLAKDLADASGAPDVSLGPYRGGTAGQTLAGEVMGTPAYMPPEQALGEAVDERADVYALGAMLYHVLAGALPYPGPTAEAILAAVVAGPPPALATRMPGVPRDLSAIVEKAMAYAPADRYPTAKQLADDLKKFQTGQLVSARQYSAWLLARRWARRHRTPLAVSIVAVALLGGLGVTSVRRIVREQARTEQSRKDAEELMNFMLLDLGDKLRPLARLDLLEEVAQKAVVYHDDRELGASDPELRTHGLARQHLGSVLLEQGNTDQALRQYRAAAAIAERLVAKDPTNTQWQQDLAASHSKLGEVLLEKGDTAGALAAYEAAMAINKALEANDPTNAIAQRHVALGHLAIGHAQLAQGDVAGALASCRAGSVIAERLATNDPTNVGWQQDLSVSHDNLGDALVAEGDLEGALAEYRSSIAITETLAANDPTNAQRWLFANLHTKIAEVMVAQGDVDSALAEHRAAMALFQALAVNDPTSAVRQRELSVSHDRVGNGLLAQGNAPGALAEYRASLDITRALAAKDPANTTWQRDLLVSHGNIGDVLLAQGDADGALAEHQALMRIAERLVAADPANAVWQRDLSIAHERIGETLLSLRDMTGALAAYRASLIISKKLAASEPTNAERQRDLSVSHNKVGDVLLLQGDAVGALAEYQAAMAIREALAASDPANAGWQRDLSISHDKIGDVLLAREDAAGALAAYRASITIAQALAANDATNAILQQDVAASHEKVGDALLARRDAAGARAAYEAGIAIGQRLRATDPTNGDVDELVTTLAAKLARCCGAKRRTRAR